jgi:two-component system, LuxR family, response regulator FixJ
MHSIARHEVRRYQPLHPSEAVYLIDEDVRLRASLAFRLSAPGRTVREFGTAEEFLRSYDSDQLGCVVCELRLRGMSGIALADELSRRGSRIPLVILTGYADTPSAVRAFKSGAFDFVEKPIDDNFFPRVEEALDAHRRSSERCRKYAGVRTRFARLTDRERQVMREVISGKANKLIAYDLGLSEKTIEAHRARVMHKLDVGTFAELVRVDTLAGLSESGAEPDDDFGSIPMLRPTGTDPGWD